MAQLKTESENNGLSGKMGGVKDEKHTISEEDDMSSIVFVREKHIEFLNSYTKTVNAEEHIYNETLKMKGVYFFISSCKLLYHKIKHKQYIINFILKCQNPDGGFGQNINYDSHIISTHYAVLSLILLNYPLDNTNDFLKQEIMKNVNKEDMSNTNVENMEEKTDCTQMKSIKDYILMYITSLKNVDGSFKGDVYGEVDARIIYCAVSCLSLLNELHNFPLSDCSTYVLSTYDVHSNGFSWIHGTEPHAASVFCSVNSLFLLGKLHMLNVSQLANWLSHRQTSNGGFNGRAEKITDTCYSWWILSPLIVLNKHTWINKNALCKYILLCQDTTKGGISDNPDCQPDIYHTFFGLAALSLVDNLKKPSERKFNLREIHPVYAIPSKIVKKRKLPRHNINFR